MTSPRWRSATTSRSVIRVMEGDDALRSVQVALHDHLLGRPSTIAGDLRDGGRISPAQRLGIYHHAVGCRFVPTLRIEPVRYNTPAIRHALDRGEAPPAASTAGGIAMADDLAQPMAAALSHDRHGQIGRASCRERVYVLV